MTAIRDLAAALALLALLAAGCADEAADPSAARFAGGYSLDRSRFAVDATKHLLKRFEPSAAARTSDSVAEFRSRVWEQVLRRLHSMDVSMRLGRDMTFELEFARPLPHESKRLSGVWRLQGEGDRILLVPGDDVHAPIDVQVSVDTITLPPRSLLPGVPFALRLSRSALTEGEVQPRVPAADLVLGGLARRYVGREPGLALELSFLSESTYMLRARLPRQDGEEVVTLRGTCARQEDTLHLTVNAVQGTAEDEAVKGHLVKVFVDKPTRLVLLWPNLGLTRPFILKAKLPDQ